MPLAKFALRNLLLAAALGFALTRAIGLFWCSDDAFISFRYAENLNAGLGLVFNAGERVEGFTNFSWTMLVAGAMRLGADPVVFAQWAGLACFLATIGLLAWASRRIAGPTAPFLPVAAVGLALHEHAAVFASGGLETSLFTLLTTATVVGAVAARGNRGLFWAGTLGVLAAMTRPDGMLPYGIAGLVGLQRAIAARRLAPFLAVVAPGLLFFAPYFAWRWSYYGWPFPNTFYAKSAASPYPQQGLYYVSLYFGCYFVLGLGALGAVFAALLSPLRGGPSEPGRLPTRALALAIAGTVAIYVAFVTWVGGDFMFGRFLVPITPLLYLGLELPRARWPDRAFGAILMVLAAGLTLARAYPHAELLPPSGRRGVVEERLNYTPQTTAAMRQAGFILRENFAGQDSRVVILGAQAVLAYYGGFTLAIEGCTGLTDEHIAHLPIAARHSVGHEKSIVALDPEYLERRRVQFSLHLDPAMYLRDHWRHIAFGPVYGVIVTWDRAMMRHLRTRPDVTFLDFERVLDDWIAGMPHRSDAEVRAQYAEWKRFYFDHNDDPAHEAPFLARLGPR